MTEVAWYDLKGKGWLRDLLIILHPPYTLWHLCYVLIGAGLAPGMNWATLGWTLLAFFLGMGIGGHCLDEICGRPLKTNVPGALLWTLAVVSVAGAIAIGVIVGMRETMLVIPCVIFGGFIVFAYNLEWPSAEAKARPKLVRLIAPLTFLPRDFFHHDFWFGFAWGALPAMTAYIAQTHTVSWCIVGVAAACLLYSMTQRVLSSHAREFRRTVRGIEGVYYHYGSGPVCPHCADGGGILPLTTEVIIGPAEVALKFMTWTVVAAAIGMLLSNI